ncbi:MAG TPA: hypothetical protein VLI92_02365 [Candidatus Saccharimonadales bacterium]|nr:hypothetical protein [Candidatus Saccharimonadales bacterium]
MSDKKKVLIVEPNGECGPAKLFAEVLKQDGIEVQIIESSNEGLDLEIKNYSLVIITTGQDVDEAWARLRHYAERKGVDTVVITTSAKFCDRAKHCIDGNLPLTKIFENIKALLPK